jgi:hypothetical protein
MRLRTARLRFTLGAAQGYNKHDFVQEGQKLRVTPHVARGESYLGSALPAKLASTPGYQVS